MLIGGVDEVGMGALAGPMVACCVILEADVSRSRLHKWWPLSGVADSKTLSEAERERMRSVLTEFILEHRGGVGISEMPVSYINTHGHEQAHRRVLASAVSKAVGDYGKRPDLLIVDGNKGIDGYAGRQKIEPKADGNYWVVAAASILAKIIRDDLMVELGKKFPKYDWGRNKGYPTPEHKNALVELGLSPYHREKASSTFLKRVKRK